MRANPPKAKLFFRPKHLVRNLDRCADLDPAASFGQKGRIFSQKYNAFYFDCEGLITLEQATFLHGLISKKNWRHNKSLVIGEIGFGLGLNFSTINKLWKGLAPSDARLHYVSVEQYPLTLNQIEKLKQTFTGLRLEYDELCRVYPSPHSGFSRVWLNSDSIALTLIFGPIVESLSELEGQIDAWIMGDFSPEQSPEMWSEEVFNEIGRLSVKGALLKSRYGTQFILDRLEKIGCKLTETTTQKPDVKILLGEVYKKEITSYIPPWFRPPDPIGDSLAVGIIGAGVAGSAVARALHRRGKKVIIIDLKSKLAGGASGIPAALISPMLSLQSNDLSDFYDRSYRMVLSSLAELGVSWQNRGVLKLLQKQLVSKRIDSLTRRINLWDSAAVGLNPSEASDKANLKIQRHGIWFNEAGVINPDEYICKMTRNCEFLPDQTIGKLAFENNRWSLYSPSGNRIQRVEALIIASAGNANSYDITEHLPLNGIRGQLSIVPETSTSSKLRATVLGGNYLMPAINNFHVIGSTHERGFIEENSQAQPVSAEAHNANLMGLVPEIQSLFIDSDRLQWSGFTGIRAATSDRLPLVGPIAEPSVFREYFDRLRHGPRGEFPDSPVYQPNLYIIAGLGSRGFLTAEMSAEILVSQMLGEPWPVERRVALSLSPSRFLYRELRAKT